MANRNLEDIVYDTLCATLVDVTGIASGKVFAKMPDYEFIRKLDSNVMTSTNADTFPSIGMRYWDKVRYSSNTYGETRSIDNGNGTGIEYMPLGEYEYPISIYLFTDTRYDQNVIGNKIMQEFSQGKFYATVNDELDDEYIQVEFMGFNDTQQHRPYVKVFDICVQGRVFYESSGYLVDYIDVNLQSQENSITANVNAQDTFSYFASLPPDEIDPDTIYFQDWNIVPVDLTDDSGGTHERTIDDNP